MNFQEWTENQRRVFIDTEQLYEAMAAALMKSRSYRGGMHWKKSAGREYLFRSMDREGNGKSLGPRSPETERILQEFRRHKAEVKERLTGLRRRMAEQARFCKAARIGRVPRVAAAVLRMLEQRSLLGSNVLIVGTHCLFAYEARAGLFMDRPLMATTDIDLLWDTRSRLKLVGDNKVRADGLIGILRKADRTFEPVRKRTFRAVNRDGFMVDLIKAAPRSIIGSGNARWGSENDLEAAEVHNLQWLVSAPKFSQMVIGEDGFPAVLAGPDPRAFVLHKFWLAGRTDREPLKKRRDREQAKAVAEIVARYLPDHPFRKSDLRMFPRDVIDSASRQMTDAELPAGFDENG